MAKVSLRSYNREIETMIDRGQLDEAIAHGHHILKTFPKHLETYRLLGKAYLEGKRYGDAVDIFQRILASVPNDFVAQVGMSIIRDEENKLNDAIWHMERAFETQPSNSAIQSELQRLYGRRDGVQPPRIRMTRGALAHMYVQGELYPQAISEIKSVLKEDPERSDMQALLARACFKSGAKNDAVDAALAMLQKYPYSLDANRVLVEVLNADRNENAQAYRQRVVELDPYAAQVNGSVFQSNEVSDAAVSIERLDWNGQPVGMQSDWRESRAISLESGMQSNQEPDWMKNSFAETTSPALPQTTSGSMFEDSTPSALPPAQPADEIPDFLKAAGWGESTGTFDESKSMFADDEPASPVGGTLAEGDLPDWIKAMKPQGPAATEEAEEALPDWINNIGPGGTLSAQPAAQPDQPAAASTSDASDLDWMNQFASSAPAAQSTDQPDWLKGLDSNSDFAPQAAQTDVPDWMKGLGDETPSTPAAQGDSGDWMNSLGNEPSADQQTSAPDWMSGLGDPTPATPATQGDVPDWMSGLGAETPSVIPQQTDTDWMKELTSETPAIPSAPSDMPDWARGLGSETPAASSEQTESPDWMNALGNETSAAPSAQSDIPDWMSGLGNETPVTSAQSADVPDWVRGLGDESPASSSSQTESPDWMSALGNETPAIPSVSTDVPDWISGVGDESGVPSSQTAEPDWLNQFDPQKTEETSSAPVDFDFLNDFTQQPAAQAPAQDVPATPAATSGFDTLGVSEQERDDSFAWLENLAAKQGASEGLLTKPEDRLQEEPEWVKQAKGISNEPPVTAPAANMEDLGKSEQERDDSFAWLENLAAKQGASEGLLTKPEDRLQEEPEWVKQAKESASEPPVAQTPVTLPSVNAEELGKSDQERDDSFSWLESLAAKQGASEGLLTKPEERMQEEPEWVKQAKDAGTPQSAAVTETPVVPAGNVEELGKSDQERDDSFSWLEGLAAKQGASEGLLTKPEERMQEEPEWVKQAKDAGTQQPPVVAQAPAVPPANVEELGKSDQERDDSFSWLEGLAAKQGASEGLLTKPEERMQEEPEWVKQAKDSAVQQPASESSVPAAASVEELGKSEQERDDSFSWLESLAAKQGASEGLLTKPEERMQEEPEWVKQAKESNVQQPPVEQSPAARAADTGELGKSTQEQDDSFAWLENLAAKQGATEGLLTKPEERMQEEPEWVKQAKDLSAQQEPAPASEQPDDTEAWLKDLAEKESATETPAQMLDVDMPAWMNNIVATDEPETPAAEATAPANEVSAQSDWIGELESPVSAAEEKPREDELPNWLSELEKEEQQIASTGSQDDLPEWLRGEDVAPSQTPERTRTTDWKPAETRQPEPEPVYTPPPVEEKQPEPEIIYSPPLMEEKQPEPEPEVVSPPPPVVEQPVLEQQEMPRPEPKAKKPAGRAATPVAPPRYVEPVTRRGTGMLVMPGVDPMLGMARSELSRSNIPGALESYGKLIKKGRFLDEVIYDLREALYRYPVEVSIWQSLGDAYMRANRLQDALDAYTKAEELLR